MCPKCNSTKTGVYNSRKNGKHGGSVWRRRHCQKCFHNWSTVEISQDSYDELTNKSKLLETLRTLEKTASNILGKVKGILPADGITSHVHADLDDDHWDIIQHIHSKKPYKLYNLPIMWPTNSEE
jgi:phosphopentomutase